MESTTQPQEETEKSAQQTQEATKPAIAPGQMRVIKRNGSVVSYDPEKIAIAITKAFLAVEGGAAAASGAELCRAELQDMGLARHLLASPDTLPPK